MEMVEFIYTHEINEIKHANDTKHAYSDDHNFVEACSACSMLSQQLQLPKMLIIFP